MQKNLTSEQMLQEPKKYIPKGDYCYDENGQCPFWELKEDEYPKYEDGYCHYLKKSDWELNEERQKNIEIIELDEDKAADIKKFIENYENSVDPKTKKKCHFPMSLLYDECKECDINMEWE